MVSPISASLFDGEDDALEPTAFEPAAPSASDTPAKRKPRKLKASKAEAEPPAVKPDEVGTGREEAGNQGFDPEEYIRRRGLNVTKKD